MNIWHLVYRVDSLTYTVSRALTEGGHAVNVWVVQPDQDYGLSEGIYRALLNTQGVGFVGRDEARLPSVIDRLIVQTHPRASESTQEAPLLAGRARAITLISSGDRNRSQRTALELQWLEARRLWRHLGKVDRVVYKDGFHRRDLFGSFKPRSNLGFDVHSQFLDNAELFRLMHAQDWDPDAPRPFLVNFLGCRDPDIRERILASIRDTLKSAARDPLATGFNKPAAWHEYSNDSPIGLDPKEFLGILARSDYTLCPRGYSMVTHRPIEAMLRGSIPVLAAEEIDLYGIGLADRENCIAVAEGRWLESIHRLVEIEERDVIRMRRNIRAMFESRLDYDALAGRLRASLGAGGESRRSGQLTSSRGAAVVS
jgi:hypothetical protein